MAVRKKGSRRIIVDGVAFQWRFPPRPNQSQGDGWPGVRVTVNRADCPKGSLLIGFPRRFHPSGPVCHVPTRPVLPSDVAAGIRAAFDSGWVADRPGAQYVLLVPERDACRRGYFPGPTTVRVASETTR